MTQDTLYEGTCTSNFQKKLLLSQFFTNQVKNSRENSEFIWLKCRGELNVLWLRLKVSLWYTMHKLLVRCMVTIQRIQNNAPNSFLPSGQPSKTRLFADDFIVYRTIHTTSDTEIKQGDLYQLAEWEKTWGMDFHPRKCCVVSATRAWSSISHTYILKWKVFERHKSIKYLMYLDV